MYNQYLRMLRHIILVGLITSAFAAKLSYKNYKVYRIIPGSDKDLKLLNKLEEKGFSYWRSPSRTLQSVDLMVAPEKFGFFEKFMNDHHMKHQLIVKDVQQLIDQENPPREKRSLYNNGTLNLNQYHTLEEIYKWFHDLEKRYPDRVQILVGGKSYDGQEIKGVHINHGAHKPSVFLEGGVHANEWISPATIICLTKWILKSTDRKTRVITESYNWYMFPVINPDGYVYTFEEDRFWRKNRSKKNSTECIGTDLNRNWDYFWDQAEVDTQDPCSDRYKGSKPFSEVETSTLSQFIRSISDKIQFYIPFHAYGHYLLFPQSCTGRLRQTYERYVQEGTKFLESINSKYSFGLPNDLLHQAITGTSMDWVTSELKIPYSFTYVLQPKFSDKLGFIVPATRIRFASKEIFHSLMSLLDEASNTI